MQNPSRVHIATITCALLMPIYVCMHTCACMHCVCFRTCVLQVCELESSIERESELADLLHICTYVCSFIFMCISMYSERESVRERSCVVERALRIGLHHSPSRPTPLFSIAVKYKKKGNLLET